MPEKSSFEKKETGKKESEKKTFSEISLAFQIIFRSCFTEMFCLKFENQKKTQQGGLFI